jgi:autotransporter-associated beta strand protein
MRIHRGLNTVVLSAAVMLASKLSSAHADVVSQWTAGSGAWSNPDNWTAAIPDNPGDSAIFGPLASQPPTALLTLDADRTLGAITFNNSSTSYTLAQGIAGTLLLRASTTNTSISLNLATGQHIIEAPIDANAPLVINASANNTPTTLTLAGSLTSTGDITFSNSGPLSADLHLTGTISTGPSAALLVGGGSGPTRLLVDGGIINANKPRPGTFFDSSLRISAPNASAALRLTAGTITTTGEFWLGENSTFSSYSAFTQTGGTVLCGSFFVVGNVGDNAIFNMSGGAFTVQEKTFTIGAGAGPRPGNSIGIANISGGTFNAPDGIYVGEFGKGVLTLSGSATLTAGSVELNRATSTPAVLNLLGGTLTTASLRGTNSSFVNFNGGVFKVLDANFFSSGSFNAFVFPGGAYIDTNFNLGGITFKSPTGNGVASIALAGVAVPGATFIDTPIVQITNAPGDTTGIGATAVAVLDPNGNIIGVNVTNPGVNYTLPPVVNLIGGGGPSVVVGSVTLSPNTSGPLTKSGTGKLSLSGVQAYTGPTIVNAGILEVAGTITGTSSISVNGGATLTSAAGNIAFLGGRITRPVIIAGGTLSSTRGALGAFDGAPSTLTLTSTLTLGGSAGQPSLLQFDVGLINAATDRVLVTAGSVTVNPGGAIVSLRDWGGIVPGTNYKLVTYASSVPLPNVTLASDSTRLGLNTVQLFATTTDISVTVTGAPIPAEAYWTGAYGSSWAAIGGPSSDQANFNTSATGSTNTLQLPGAVTNINFVPLGPPADINTTLGRNFIIHNLVAKTGAGSVIINGTSNLIITGSLICEAGSGGIVLNCPLFIPTVGLNPLNQTFTNLSSSPVVLNGSLATSGLNTPLLTTTGDFLLTADWPAFSLKISSGTFQIGNGGTTGSLGSQGVTNTGVLAVNRSDNSQIFDAISGSGSLVLLGTGTLSLYGNNTYTGPTIISTGTLQIPSFGSVGTGPIINQGTLLLNRLGLSLTLTNAISGTGTLSHIDTGTATLTGPYTATGPINIAAGTLLFANSSAPRQTLAILITTNSLSISNNNSMLDLTNHDLMITNNTPSSSNTIINTLWKNGTAALTGNGDPNGPQITSSTATNNTSSFPTFLVAFDLDRLFGNGTTGDGSAIGQNLGAYTDNQPVTQPGTIMVKYGYYADLDFSGKVDAGDINLILGALGQTTPGMADPGLAYLTGDIDYSGKVDAGDINLVLGMLGAGSGGTEGNPLGIRDAQPLDTSPAPPASHIPEPSAVSLLALGSIFLLPRRRTTTVQKNSPPLGRSTGGAGRKE